LTTPATLAPTAPDRDRAPGETALLVVDMISPLEACDQGMVDSAIAAARVIDALRKQADRLHMPTIFVNDNFGEWHSEKSRIVDRASRTSAGGKAIVEILPPRDQDYFVIKPQFSGFYATNLAVLLPKLGVSRLILTGMSADICVLFTAADAHMRDYDLWIPEDATASESAERTRWALDIAHNAMGAAIRPSSALTIKTWLTTLETENPRRKGSPDAKAHSRE
jgi:nicotinamidase-related amidase